MNKLLKFIKPTFLVAIALVMTFASSGVTYALSAEQKRLYQADILYYDKGFNNDCVVASTTQSRETVYVVGDSIGEGLQQNELTKKLRAAGYTNITYNVSQNRGPYKAGVDGDSAIAAVSKDKDAIQKAGTIIIVLGTNPDNYKKGVGELMTNINAINGSAQKFWVNAGVTNNNLTASVTAANKEIEANADEFNYKIINWANKATKSLLSADGVHPNASGYNVLGDLIVNVVGKIEKAAGAVSGSTNAEKIWSFFIGKGLTPNQTAGIMGNMKAEAHFEPRLVEYGLKNSRGEISVQDKPSSLDDRVPPNQFSNGRPGYGIVQFTYPGYKQDLRDISAKTGVSAGNLQLQLDYLWKVIGNTGYMKEIKNTTSASEVSDIFLIKFEKPADIEGTKQIRRKFAQDMLELYSGLAGTISSCSDETLNAGGLGWNLEGTNKMVYYAQTDPKWADKKYGNCSPETTIKSSGCGVATMAMIVSTLTSTKIEPPEMAKLAVDNGFRVCGEGTDHGLGPFVAKKYGLKYSQLGTDFDKAAEILKTGGLIWISVGKGTFTSQGHIMVIRKVSDDGQSFYLADPYSEEGRTKGESNTKAYTRDELTGAGNITVMYGFTK